MSPSLPLFPEPMVNMWPSSSLQPPTSDAFLGIVGFTSLPWPSWPQPALLPFLLCPPWPALGVRAIFLCLGAPTGAQTVTLEKNPWDSLSRVLLGHVLSLVNSHASLLLLALQRPMDLFFCMLCKDPQTHFLCALQRPMDPFLLPILTTGGSFLAPDGLHVP